MKNLILSLIIVAMPFIGDAQTNLTQVPNQIPTVTATTFFDSAGAYLTSFNTNYSWATVTFDASIGYKQVTGSGAN
jgi:hypothetical protein